MIEVESSQNATRTRRAMAPPSSPSQPASGHRAVPRRLAAGPQKPLGAHYEAGRVAALLDMSVRFVKDEVKAGKLKGFRLGSRIVVCAESLDDYLFNRQIGGAA